MIGVDDGVDVVKGEVEKPAIVGEVLSNLFGRGALTVGVRAVDTGSKSDDDFLVKVGGELTNDVVLCAEGRTEPSAHAQFVEVGDHFGHGGPMLSRTLHQAQLNGDLAAAPPDEQFHVHIEVPHGARQILLPDFDAEHEIIVGGGGEGEGRGVGAGSHVLRVRNGGESERVQDHVGKADYDGHYDRERQNPSRESPILILIFVSQHLTRIEEIRHFHHFLETF